MFALVLVLGCASAILFPLPARVYGKEESYLCDWADGSSTEESYDSAFASLTGADGEGVTLLRGGVAGRIAGSGELLNAVSVFEEGNLGELYAMRPLPNRIERVALWRTYGERVYYDGEAFRWNGERVVPTADVSCKEFVLLAGGVSASLLARSGAERLYLRSEAEFTAKTLAGTAVSEVLAQPPYSVSGGAVYLDTTGGKRLVGAVPALTALTVEDCDFADAGALVACRALESLSVPFAGSAFSAAGSDRAGEFAYLFLDGGEYAVPESLKRATVRGGVLDAYAFYACPYVEEVRVCGVAAENLSPDSFLGMASLCLLCAPLADLPLTGEFESSLSPCGCTVYRRTV